MEQKVERLLLISAVLFLLVYGAFNSIKGGFVDLAKAVIAFGPIFLILMLRLRRFWHVMIIAFLAANNVRAPVYGLHQLSLLMILLLSALLFNLADRSIGSLRVRSTWIDKLVLLILLVSTGRMIHDRPGFVALGMAYGGFFDAFTIVAASWFYFVAKQIATEALFTRKQLKCAGTAVLLFAVHDLIKGDESGFFWRPLGAASYWMLCAIWLALSATTTSVWLRAFGMYGGAILFALAGIISGYRARFFYYVSEALSVSYFQKGVIRMIAVLLAFLGAGLAVVSGTDVIPDLFRRFTSLFREVEQSVTFVGGAYGWGDTYRADLTRLAFREIRKNPWLGSGFGLNVGEAIAILTADTQRHLSLLALSGSYHNSILMLSVKCGLVASLSYVIVSGSIITRFINAIKKANDPDIRTWGMAIVAFWLANLWQIMFNGGHIEYFASMVMNGYMMGMMGNKHLLAAASARNDAAKGDDRVTPYAHLRSDTG